MATPLTHLTIPFTGTPAYFSGTGSTTLVPSVYPVAINGRPYMVDQKSGKFARGYEQRVRDSVDQSTAPGESAINPGGLWRRGEDSWHYGAGQLYADVAEAQDYRFYKSKGVNPWVKGQLSLLNSTTKNVGSGAPSTATNQFMCVAGGYIYVADGQSLKRTSTVNGNWTTITTGAIAANITALCSDGTRVFIAYTGNAVYMHDSAGTSISAWVGGADTYDFLDYANGRIIGSHGELIYDLSKTTKDEIHDNRNAAMRFYGAAAGQGYIYIGGHAGDASLIYKTTIKPDATGLDDCSVAAQLPYGEIVSSLDAYLGYIFIGSNKGVRMATSDAAGNLTLGSIIPTSGDVNQFSGDGRFVWFTWTNYDGISSGLGRLDLSTFIGTNTPAFASDLMNSSTNVVRSVITFEGLRLFSIDGEGVFYENTASLVAEGTIESGTYRWGIPDRKFVAKVDARTEPLKGSVTAFLSNDRSVYASLGTWNSAGQTEYTYNGSDAKTIEASFKFLLTRSATVTQGPVLTRWMARAYAAPFRSQFFVVPVLLHHKLKLRDREYHLNVQEEQDAFDNLIANPSIVTLQIGTNSHSVIVEDVEWTPLDSFGNSWEWEGTATITMRSVEN